MNTRIQGCVPPSLATVLILNFHYSPGCRELKTTSELMNYKCSLWMSYQKDGNKKFPKQKKKKSFLYTHPITVECQVQNYEAEGGIHQTHCTNFLLAFTGKFLKCLQRKWNVQWSELTTMWTWQHSYDPGICEVRQENCQWRTGWKTLNKWTKCG